MENVKEVGIMATLNKGKKNLKNIQIHPIQIYCKGMKKGEEVR